jgi:hypothetical protein
MTGGLIQLVAYGNQDLFVTKDPQITFFKVVYRRHTNFSSEFIQQPFTHTPDFGKRVTCVLGRNGDLIRKMYLVAVLPRIPQFVDEDNNNQLDDITKFAWVKRIGYALINNVEIEIGGEVIDEHYGDWLNIWHELTVKKEKEIDKMIGNIKELTDHTNGKKFYKLFIPLQFWFNRVAGLALPIVGLQYNHIKINLEIASFNKLYTVTPTHFVNVDNDFVNFKEFEYIEQIVDGVRSLAQFVHFDIVDRRLFLYKITNNGFLSLTEDDQTKITTEEDQDRLLFAKDAQGNLINGKFLIRGLTTEFEAMPRINSTERSHTNRSVDFNNIVLKDAFMLIEYIFLDDEERVRFSQARHEYLIEQLLYNGEKTINGLHQQFKLGFIHPTKEIYWVTQLSQTQNTRINDHFNYTDAFERDEQGELIGKNISTNATLFFNGKERVTFREIQYFDDIQSYQHHTNGPREGISMYSFCVNPEKHQPSGVANLSKIDNIRLRLAVQPQIDFLNTAKIRVYGITYNILRIANGISGLVFSRDT